MQGDTLSADRHLNPEPEQLLASQLVGQLCQLQCYYGHRLLITDTRRHAAILTFNIARGTTDPEINSVTWTKFGNNMAPLALVAYLATRWRHLHLPEYAIPSQSVLVQTSPRHAFDGWWLP